MKNHLCNMFTSIQNGQLVRKSFVIQNNKKTCEAFLNILWNEGFILGYKVLENDLNKCKIFLKYVNGKPAINSFKFMSKPGRKVYYSVKQLWKLDPSKTFMILSTNKGLKTLINCKKLKIGGELFVIIN